jgi:Uma2 family endonuclease
MSTKVESPNVEATLAFLASYEPGERKVIEGVSWEEYEQLLDELGEGYAVRVAYTEGMLELMAPLYKHEKNKDFLLRLVSLLTRELGLKLESAGSTTLKRKDLARGAEPDTCFYIQHAAQVIGKETIDLQADPPPDIVVEIDVTSKSHSKLTTYARFGVPEFWRYDGKTFQIFGLAEGRYVEQEASVTFPFVTARDFEAFIEQSKTEGQDAALDSFQQWVSERKPA